MRYEQLLNNEYNVLSMQMSNKQSVSTYSLWQAHLTIYFTIVKFCHSVILILVMKNDQKSLFSMQDFMIIFTQ